MKKKKKTTVNIKEFEWNQEKGKDSHWFCGRRSKEENLHASKLGAILNNKHSSCVNPKEDG